MGRNKTFSRTTVYTKALRKNTGPCMNDFTAHLGFRAVDPLLQGAVVPPVVRPAAARLGASRVPPHGEVEEPRPG